MWSPFIVVKNIAARLREGFEAEAVADCVIASAAWQSRWTPLTNVELSHQKNYNMIEQNYTRILSVKSKRSLVAATRDDKEFGD